MTRLGWEQHCCLPLEASCDIAPLDRYHQVGFSYVSVNVGYAPHDIDSTMRVISSWRRQILQTGDPFQLVGTADDIDAAWQAARLVVGFDLGINGVGIFLGDNDASASAMARHIDYAVQLVGPEHVGIGTDYVFDNDDLSKELAKNTQVFPASYQGWDAYKFVEPEQLPAVESELQGLGYSDNDIAAIMGGNFLRVAKSAWK